MFIKYFVIAFLKLYNSGMKEFEIISVILIKYILHYHPVFGGCLHPDGVDKLLEAGFGHLAVPLQGGPHQSSPKTGRYLRTLSHVPTARRQMGVGHPQGACSRVGGPCRCRHRVVTCPCRGYTHSSLAPAKSNRVGQGRPHSCI